MRKERETASDGPGALSRIGALGVLLTGALLAALISVASRVPPDPVDEGSIPGIVIRNPGPDAEKDPAARGEHPARPREGRRPGGEAMASRDKARTVAHREAGGGRRQAVARPDTPPAGPAPDRLDAGTGSGGDDDGVPLPGAGTRGGDDDDDPGARAPGTGRRGGDDDDGRAPPPAGGDDDDGAAPVSPAPAPAENVAAPPEQDDDDGTDTSLSTTTRVVDDDGAESDGDSDDD